MALAFLITSLAVQTVFAQKDVPFCLQTCLTEVGTSLCAAHALHDLTPCLAKSCPNPPATQNLIASLNVAFTPKAEYSCQQGYGPGSPESSSVTLPLNGSCATSPYGFKSFLPVGVSKIRANNACEVMIFSDEDCLGEEATSDIGTLSNGQCVFRGGRSARLACRNAFDAARAYMQTECGGRDDDAEETSDDTSSSSSSNTIYPSSAPYHGPGPTSSGTGTSTSIPFHWPFSTNSGTVTASASSSLSTNTADAAGGSPNASTTDTATPTLPSASASAPSSGNGSEPNSGDNGNNTSPSSAPQNGTYTLATPTADATALPSYTGLAVHLGGTSVAALGLVGAGFVLFL